MCQLQVDEIKCDVHFFRDMSLKGKNSALFFLFIIPDGWNADIMAGASTAILDSEDGLEMVEQKTRGSA